MSAPRTTAARGFTLLETTLALFVGGLVIVTVTLMMSATRNTDRAYARAFEQTAALAMTQAAVRSSFLSLLMLANEDAAQTDATDDEAADEEADQTGDEGADEEVLVELEARPRIVLEPDSEAIEIGQALGTPWGGEIDPQRLEVVLSRAPLPDTFAGVTRGWAFAEEDADSLNFATAGGGGGRVRGVYELRPDGYRERRMRQLGLQLPINAAPPADVELDGQDRSANGWTLWWRRMPGDEVLRRRLGRPARTGADEDDARRLAGSIPLVTGLSWVRWRLFEDRVRRDAYGALVVADLPAYAELELRATDQTYANWMFEIGWDTGADPTGDAVEIDLNDPGSGGDDGTAPEAAAEPEGAA